ncbi:MAG TPA: plastocyanin/azurin family copper-binding protein [Alphaproteobacteria bacterium]|nr:plastocyanin/azurin family copper-binding protein [Alphaproteobacteria bacterium]
MPKLHLPPVCGVVLAMMLGGCGLGGPAYRAPSGDAAAIVDMGWFSFEPAEVAVRAGETVEWRNTSPTRHTVTADPAKADDPADVALPAGAEPFDSGRIPPGETYRRRFTVPGTYRYFCIPHEDMGMVATVIVEPMPGT